MQWRQQDGNAEQREASLDIRAALTLLSDIVGPSFAGGLTSGKSGGNRRIATTPPEGAAAWQKELLSKDLLHSPSVCLLEQHQWQECCETAAAAHPARSPLCPCASSCTPKAAGATEEEKSRKIQPTATQQEDITPRPQKAKLHF
ncbi:hypothetical protein cyc_04099 [Cyclospora cayetanensis]|uniref:Uncharacterized protein n=1 Tax=Cyclospora cayetanensis TaxID=88456 RepID=A0A1D3D6J8_9EIME|nr:hypothetical protein cyc_04099 [Cyclospora cayetanensis]